MWLRGGLLKEVTALPIQLPAISRWQSFLKNKNGLFKLILPRQQLYPILPTPQTSCSASCNEGFRLLLPNREALSCEPSTLQVSWTSALKEKQRKYQLNTLSRCSQVMTPFSGASLQRPPVPDWLSLGPLVSLVTLHRHTRHFESWENTF